MSAPLDVHRILWRAGADAYAARGSDAWERAQLDEAVRELVSAVRAQQEFQHRWDDPLSGATAAEGMAAERRVRTALARFGGAP